MEFKNRVKELRARYNLNQSDLGKLVKASRQTISLIERGDYSPSIVLALRIAKVLKVNVEEVFYLEGGIIMEKVVGACGCICSSCRMFEKECKGCHDIKGMACWLHEVGLDVCDFYECCVTDKELEHCGECAEIPCKKFWENKNPAWTEEQHRKIVEERVVLLKELAENK